MLIFQIEKIFCPDFLLPEDKKNLQSCGPLISLYFGDGCISLISLMLLASISLYSYFAVTRRQLHLNDDEHRAIQIVWGRACVDDKGRR